MQPGSRPFSTEALLAEAEWVRALARSLVGERDAADLAQEAWVAALRRRPAVGESLRPWLARVLRNQAALLRRSRGRAARDASRAAEGPLPSAAELVERAEIHRRLVGAVLRLEEPYRSIVLLHYYEGLPSVEIARRRGLPPPTVRTQHRRALERLRAELDLEEDGDRQAWMAALAPLARSVTSNAAPASAAASSAAAWAALLLLALLVGGAAWLRSGSQRVAAAPAPAGRAVAGSAELPSAAAPAAGRVPEEAEVAAAPGSSPADLRVRAVDAATLEPLPHFEVRLERAAGTLSVRSDAAGWLDLPPGLEAARAELLLLDDPRLREQDAVVHDEERVVARIPRARPEREHGLDHARLRVPCGPTYPLRLALPAGLAPADLRAHLRTPRQFFTRTWELHLAPVRRLEGDSLPWVRFGVLDRKYLGQRPPWLLEVESLDGTWAGSAEVAGLDGRQPPVQIELRQMGVVQGRASDARGAASGVLVVLRTAGGAGSERRSGTDEEGAFRFDRVEPGRYHLELDSLQHAGARQELRVAPGEVVERDVLLERLPPGGRVSGILTSRSGAYRGSVVVALAPAGGAGAPSFQALRWGEQDGRSVGRFAFEEVPDDAYELRVVSCADQLAWSPPSVRLRPPAHVALECDDGVPLVDLGFHVVDARDGRELHDVAVRYWTAGRSAVLERARAEHPGAEREGGADVWWLRAEGLTWVHVPGPFPLRGVPEDAELRWSAIAPGFRPAVGDQGDFAPWEGGRRAVVALQPGWTLRLRALAADSLPPRALAGVEVAADGRAVGRTAADGTLEIALDAAPAALSFDGGGLRVVGGDLDPQRPPDTPAVRPCDVLLRAP